MTTHRFAINIPNPSGHDEIVELALQPVAGGLQATHIPLPPGTLHVERAGISLDPCGTDGHSTLELKLKPLTSATVTVTVVTAPSAKGGTAALELVDRRGKRVAGGVTLACIDPPLKAGQPRKIPTDNPSPVALASKPYPVAPNANPSIRPANPTLMLGTTCDFVAPLTNPGRTPLDEVRAYLEHLGTSGAAFTAMTWNIGTLAPGAIFYASWRVRPIGWQTGAFAASIVVQSKGRDAVRLSAPFAVNP